MKKNGEKYYNTDMRCKTSLRKDINDVNNLILAGKKNLNDLYDLNIIPKIYRDIYSVYFINDYIQSSNEGISEAFLHLDLDTIKKQLSEVIENQKDIIFQQSILISQNSDLLNQNSQILNHLAQIDENIQVGNQYLQSTNQYARIAAADISTCRWLAQIATFDRIVKN